MNKLSHILLVAILILISHFSFSQEMKKYVCNGEGKGQGLKFSLSYPSNWTVTEGIRPHILKIFDWEDKRGKVSMTIYVSKLEEAPANEEIDLVFKKDFILSNPMLNGSKVIEFKNDAKIEDLRCMFLTVYFKSKVYDTEAYSIFKNNQIYFERYHLQVNFDVMSYDQKYETMLQMYNSYNLIFNDIMGNMAINSRWE